ncbi:Rieske (2Fe-2S) protein [Inhella proteolytica]|uniref:Rieske 2Fe-2S domain-containing protein n=1 Tax=Inhella proteolytica TaxID=2795029 RepID=A0A931J3A6_9BURK|nr:Rieske 2Fe-2S domain-containing protein [Inhella proteolytica]MBH9577973.1 Rieske 2Fe-2S domain-containing protein [Inhella proteolytica]
MVEPLRVCPSDVLEERGLGVQWELRYCGMEERAFALRIDGQVYAYLNRCAHVPTELDWQPNEFLDTEKRYILCAVHGAVYSPKTGACVMGRCGRAGLIPVRVAEFDGFVHWYPSDTLQPPLEPAAPAPGEPTAPAP